MSSIELENVSLSYPIYGVDTRSFKRNLVKFAMGKEDKSNNTNNASSIISIDALKNISLSLKKGDKVGIIGHNGAGKSTLLKVLAGIYEPLQGKVDINGKVSALLSVSTGMIPGASGYENIKTRCIMQNFSEEETQRIIRNVEEFTELGHYLSMPVKIYSSGMNLRLAFAISTAINPEILLLDEVIGAGDHHFVEKAKARMYSLIDQCSILVLASHSNELVKELCNKALWLNQGKIMAFGNPKETIDLYLNHSRAETKPNKNMTYAKVKTPAHTV